VNGAPKPIELALLQIWQAACTHQMIFPQAPRHIACLPLSTRVARVACAALRPELLLQLAHRRLHAPAVPAPMPPQLCAVWDRAAPPKGQQVYGRRFCSGPCVSSHARLLGMGEVVGRMLRGR